MAKLKVLQLISSNGCYGAENVVLELSKVLPSLNCVPTVGVFYNAHNVHLELAAEISRHHLDVKVFPCQGRLDGKLISSIRNYVQENGIQIVHSHGYKSNFYGRLATLSTEATSIATCHGWIAEGWQNKLYNTIDKLALRFFDRIAAVSAQIKNELEKWKICPERISIIDNGIDLAKFRQPVEVNHIKKCLGLKSEAKVIGSIGRLSPEKGHRYFIAAAQKVLQHDPRVIFLIIGEGELRPSLQRQIDDLKLSNHVLLLGRRQDIPQLLAIMDVYVQPSLTEGLPMTLLEAMAAQKPIIATRVGAIPQLIKNNDTGILINPGDVDMLTCAMTRLITNDREAALLSRQAYHAVVTNYSAEKMAHRYLSLYLGEGAGPG